MRVVLDPGHGGDQVAGRSTPYGSRDPRGAVEKDVTLALAMRVAQRLGGDTVLTRASDVNLSLSERSETARRRGADVFVSLHASPHRREAYVHPRAGASSRALAMSIRDAVGADVVDGEMTVLEPSRLGANTAACLLEVDALAHDAASLDHLADAVASAIRRYGQQPALVSRRSVFNPGDSHWEILSSNRPIETPHAASSIRRQTTVSDYDGWQHKQGRFTFTDESIGVEIAINATAETGGMLRGADGVGPYVRHAGASATVVRAAGFADASVGWGRTPDASFTWADAVWDDHFECAALELPIEIRISHGSRQIVARRMVTFLGDTTMEPIIDFSRRPRGR